jgi:cell division protein FtsB
MRPSRKPRIILFFLIALCGIFVYSYTARLGEKSRVEAQIVTTQSQIDAAQAEQFRLLKAREELNEPDYLDKVAREDFGLARPGDKLLVIMDQPAANASAGNVAIAAPAVANPIDYRNFPVWQQWVVFFTTSSFKFSLK